MIAPMVVILWEMVVRPVLSITASTASDVVLHPASAGTAYADSQTDHGDSLQAIRMQLREQRFWQARLEAAKRDSIYLTLDMSDGVLILEVKGVTLRRCPIERYGMSTLMRHMRTSGQGLPGDDRPRPLKDVSATIAKIPIRVLDMTGVSMEDTVDAPPTASIPDSTEAHRVVSIIFEVEPGLTLYLKQSEPLSRDNWYIHMEQLLRYRLATALEEVHLLLRGKSLPSDLWISLEIPREDAIAIYRALPANPSLIIRL
jgi:hypothetical protein